MNPRLIFVVTAFAAALANGCSAGDAGSSGAGGSSSAGPGAGDCCNGFEDPAPANAVCHAHQCVNGSCVLSYVPDGTLCGGEADASLHGECTCGVCGWANYGADPCTGVADKQPCRNGRGICYNEICIADDGGWCNGP